MPAQWLSNSSDIPGRASAALDSSLHALARPERIRQLRRGLVLLFALWAVVALSRLVWSLLPTPDPEVDRAIRIVNPVQPPAQTDTAPQVDIERLISWHLFGEASTAPVEAQEPAAVTTPEAGSRDGIEEGARETRLELTLRGVVASTEDGLGHAIIEHRKRQAVYTVEDKLPVSGEVVLAKVMPRQVVLDNGGTYELLTLFEDTDLDAQLPSQGSPSAAMPQAKQERRVEQRNDASTTALASSFRDRLYRDPQSLADVVSISAVRTDGALQGYRVSPGKQRQQFEQLGFRQGDLVTGINGIALSDPANTMRLYQTMRTASDAVFDVERDGKALSISVQLDNSGAE